MLLCYFDVCLLIRGWCNHGWYIITIIGTFTLDISTNLVTKIYSNQF